MPRSRKSQRAKHNWMKERRISPFNSYGVLDTTPHNAVHLMRGELDRLIYSGRHKPDYKPWQD